METYRENREDDSVTVGELDLAFAVERQAFLWTELHLAQSALTFNRLDSTERLAGWLLQETGTNLDDDGVRRLCYRLLAARVDVLKDEVSRLPETPQAVPPVVIESPLVSALVTDYFAHRNATDP